MSNQPTLQVTRLGKSSSMKNNLGFGSESPKSSETPLKLIKAFTKGTLNLKKVESNNTIHSDSLPTAQTQITYRQNQESRLIGKPKIDNKLKLDNLIPSQGKLSDGGNERLGARDSVMGDLKIDTKDHSDYATLLMYFPDTKAVSARNMKKSFNSFKELVKTSRGGYDELLEDIVSTTRTNKRPLGLLHKDPDQIEVVKKVLEYNKTQKNWYAKQMEMQTKDLMLPIIKQVKDKIKKTPRIKVMPSKKLDDKGTPLEIVKEFKNSRDADGQFKSSSMPNSPLPSQRKRESKLRRGSLLKFEDKAFEKIFSVYNYKIFWSHNFTNNSTWKPGVREGHTFTTIGKYAVLYGGLSNVLLDDIVLYDPARNIWMKPKVTGEVPMGGRHGHTACEFKKNLIIFGGEQQFNSTLNIRECLNDIRMFTPETNEWKYVRPLSHAITPRRYHAATIQEHMMYVYGGINNEGTFLKDVWSFSLKSFVWTKAEIPGEREPGVAFHSMAACFIDRTAINPKEKDKLHAYEEGIYVFGGKDGEGQILNTLKMFTADLKNTHWKYPNVKGTPPVARYNHSTLFYEPLGLLVIYGGKNENLFSTTGDVCLNDIKILHLEQMTWAETSSYGQRPQIGRYHHAAAMFGTKMLIFGGVELYQYADEEVKFVELNQIKARRLIETDEYREPNGRRKSQLGDLAGLMGDKEAFADDDILGLEDFYSKDMVTWQPLPQTNLLIPNGEKEIRMKLIENIHMREKYADSPRHKVVKRFNTFLAEE